MMMRPAYAKINLALDVLRKREDGYHDLRMVMQQISLADTVTVREGGEGFSFRAEHMELPVGKAPMEQRAAEVFFGELGLPMPPLEVSLVKRIPVYAGLGGGSADVAALLLMLRDRWAADMSNADLEKIGLRIGSDVPFCIRGGTVLAEGRGEVMKKLPPLPDCQIVVCKPGFGLSTPKLFAALDRIRISNRPDIDSMVSALERHDLAGIAAGMYNVFEEALPDYAGDVISIRKSLCELGAEGASMSGSGPAVFGLFSDSASAAEAAGVLKKTYPETFLAVPVADQPSAG